MINQRPKFQSVFFIVLFLAAFSFAAFASVPEKPKESAELIIQKNQKETYKEAIKILKVLKYEINQKKKNSFVEGLKGVDRVHRIVLTAQGMMAEGTRHIDIVNIWIEPVSKENCKVNILATKRILKLEANRGPTVLETNRAESIEQEIQDEFKKKLGSGK